MRFTGEPAYFKHITEAATHLMEASGTTAKDYKWAIFHQPNTKFPQRVAGQLGFSMEQIAPGLLVHVIGNTYAGAAVIGLTATLDIAQPGDRILCVSFGSGAGSDAFDILVTDKVTARQGLATKTQEYIARRTEIDYATYVRYRGKVDDEVNNVCHCEDGHIRRSNLANYLEIASSAYTLTRNDRRYYMAFFDLPLNELKTYLPPREEPADFDSFWKSTLDEARAFPLNAKFERVDYGLVAQETFDVTFSGFGGQPIKGWLILPQGATRRRTCRALLNSSATAADAVSPSTGSSGQARAMLTSSWTHADKAAPGHRVIRLIYMPMAATHIFQAA